MTLLQSPTPYDGATRQALVDALNPLSIDVLALDLIVWHAHRSCRGCGSMSIHKLLGKLAKDLDGHADRLGEYIMRLGGQPMGLPEDLTSTRIAAYPPEINNAHAHCREVFARVQALSALVQAGINVSNGEGAADALDMLTAVNEGLGYWGGFIFNEVADTTPTDDHGPESEREPAQPA
ncbi:MAG TPA: ferritin-like domain-containing protein [Methyloceanibacter sp.]|nr:ferritin-like domain-containing protein [Methyloceanibacter sp.]